MIGNPGGCIDYFFTGIGFIIENRTVIAAPGWKITASRCLSGSNAQGFWCTPKPQDIIFKVINPLLLAYWLLCGLRYCGCSN